MTSRLTADANGCLTTHLARIAANANTEMIPVLSNDTICGRETVSAMARRTNALVMVNGSYFHTTGEILGLMKLGGEIVSTERHARSAVGAEKSGKYLFGTVGYHGTIALPSGAKLAVSGVNCERGADMCILYRPSFGTHTGTNLYGTEYIIRDGRITAVTGGNSPLEAGTVVVSAHGTAREALSALQVGDEITISETLGDDWDKADWIVGAGPALIKDGKIHITAQEEAFGTDVAGGRAPRSAVGITKDGTILLAVIEGRHTLSRGMTLDELAAWLKAEGAVDAVNLDGGGSSVMWAGEGIVSTPSDQRERQVGNAIGIFLKK